MVGGASCLDVSHWCRCAAFRQSSTSWCKVPGNSGTLRTVMERRERTDWKIGCALAALLALSGCGGGGGGGGGGVISTPAPVPTPTPTPAPTPTPTSPPVSPASFDTAEFRRSDGPGYHNAPTAWAQGATGSGVKIAVIDTGIGIQNDLVGHGASIRQKCQCSDLGPV